MNYPLIAAIPSDSIGREIFANGLYEEDLLLALFDRVLSSHRLQFSRAIALDVGANIGNHTLFFANRFAQVIAFEPYPALAKILDANLCLNNTKNVVLRQVGLSDEEASIEYVPGASDNLGGGGFRQRAYTPGCLSLPVRCGDNEIKSLKITERVAAIKIDVEGHEFQALRGLGRTITNDVPFILFEANDPIAPGGGAEIYEWLQGRGYRHLYSVGPQWILPSIVQHRLKKVAGLLHLTVTMVRGYDYSFTEITALAKRPYPLLLASPTPLKPDMPGEE